MKYARKEFVAFLMERYGTNDKTEVEVEEFLTEIIGKQSESSIEDFLDSCFGMWKEFRPQVCQTCGDWKTCDLIREARNALEKSESIRSDAVHELDGPR